MDTNTAAPAAAAFVPDLKILDAFIFDLDGVIWRGDTPIFGAVASLRALRAAGRRCFFCTNNSSRSQADFANRLRGMGIELDDQDVLTSASATAFYLGNTFPAGFSAYVVGEAGLIAALQGAGANVVGESSETERVDCVVAGIDRVFTYDKLQRAQKFILNGARFIATNRDATFPTESGVVPGAGSIVASIETASGITPVTIGKPEPIMVRGAIEQFGLDPLTTAMIGDRLDTDIACAHRAGITALMVATGVSSLEAARAAQGELRPHACFDDLPALCDAVL